MKRWMLLVLTVLLSLSMVACVDEDVEATEAESPADAIELPSDVSADIRGKSDTVQIAPGTYVAGLPSLSLEVNSAPGSEGRQRKTQWCWAAVTQMIVNYHGVDVDQEYFVYSLYDSFLNRPATASEITSVIHNRTLTDNSGYGWYLQAQPSEILDLGAFISDLHFRQPFLVGLQNDANDPSQGGHAFVMTAITYQMYPDGRGMPLSVTLRDPWPENPSRQDISWEEFEARYMFNVRVRVTPLQ